MAVEWLADVLRQAGVAVAETDGWRTRGVSGAFDPIGVLWHHTAATSSASNPAPSLATVINGATAAVLSRLGRDAGFARGHLETSTTGKIDPAFVNLDRMRQDVAGVLTGGGGGVGPMYHQVRRPNGTWTGFTPIAGYGTTEPGDARDMGIAGLPNGSAQLLIIGADWRVYHQVRGASGIWTGFETVAGFGTTAPAAGSRVSIAGLPDGSTQVLIIGADNGVYHQVRSALGT